MLSPLLMFAFMIVVELTGDLSFYYSFQSQFKHYENTLIVCGAILYLIMAFTYYHILKHYNDIAIPNAIYQALTVIAVTLLSLFVVKDTFTIRKTLGIIIVLIGLFVLYEY
jgi:multidrug transporter EmrE-like cation transporter